MRAIGIDWGKVRVGVAVTDELGLLAHPRPYLDARDRKKLLAALTELANAESATRFVVGVPRALDGREGRSARHARQFGEQLAAHSGLPVELHDEWLTTREAQGRLRALGISERQARSRVDSASAAIMLQSWLDAQRSQP
jgi:putative holliday junction resolvase